MIMLLAFVAFIILLFSNRSLSARVSALESKFQGGKVPGEIKPEPANANTNINMGMAEPAAAASDATPAPQIQTPNRFAVWLREDWLMKLGAFLFIVGFGWFVSYAFANNWIGPIGRTSIGVVAGVIIMALGFWRMTKYKAQGAVFMALGAGMAILTIFAGRSIYGFFTPVSAVALDFVIAVFVSFASYKFNVKSLAVIAQILAFVSPLLTAGSTDSMFLFSYLFFISLATLFFASITGWRDLIASSLIFVGLYSIPYISAGSFGSSVYSQDAPIILNFIYLFGVMYLLAGMFSVVRKGVENAKNEIFLVAMNGLLLLMWILNVAPKEWHSMLFAVWAVVFIISSFVAFKFSSRLEPFYAYGAVAVTFIGAATAAQLSGAALTIAFTVEVLLVVLNVLMLTKNIKAASAASWLFAVPVVMSLSSISRYSTLQELFNKDFFVLILIAGALILAGRVMASNSSWENQNPGEKYAKAGTFLIVFGIFYLGYILWQFIHILMSDTPDMATMTTLVIYTIFGLIAYFSGLYGDDLARRTYGIALLAFVVIRLIIVDVWQMELFGRVITFLAIGVLLMSTAFLTKKKKNG